MFESKNRVDTFLLILIISLTVYGILIFLSASIGLLARNSDIYASVAMNQLTLGLLAGSIFAFIFSKVNYKIFKKHSIWIFILSVIITLLVFIPGIGSSSGGASRWIWLGPLSFQPAELLKIAYLILISAWFSMPKEKIQSLKFGLIPFLIISGIAGGILIAQPDNDTALIMLATGFFIYMVSGASLKHIIPIIIIGIIGASLIIINRPHVLERIKTFVNPMADPMNSGYQVQQSLISLGSGGISGKGFGNSVQKYGTLPEPIGDSIFAVLGEEFGFIGTSLLVLLFLLFLIRSTFISLRVGNKFGGLLILGLAILITSQSLINMASMLGIFPLSGLPLLFVSHGGSALFFTLCATGIMLNISRHKQQT